MDYKKLVTEVETKTLSFNGEDIKILKYLPTRDKLDLVQITLQKSAEKGIFNEVKLDTYFHLYLVYLYTDIAFSDDDRADEFALYDDLVASGLFDAILSEIEDDEYEMLWNYLIDTKGNILTYGNSAAGVIRDIIQDLPTAAAEAAKIAETFDTEKYKEVIEFAKAANNGNPIQ